MLSTSFCSFTNLLRVLNVCIENAPHNTIVSKSANGWASITPYKPGDIGLEPNNSKTAGTLFANTLGRINVNGIRSNP